MKSKFQYSLLFFILLLAHVAAGVFMNGYSGWYIVIAIVFYLIVLIVGSAKIQWNFYLKSMNKLPMLKLNFAEGNISIQQREKQVALTFDDGPAEYTERILDVLKRESVPATFFLIGKNISNHEALVLRMKAEGHAIGNHSFEHGFSFDWQNAAKMQQEIEQTNDAINAITQGKVTLFRPPYGVTNPNLAKAISGSGMRSIGWNVRSFDTTAKSEEKLLQRILKKTKSRSIILLHDSCAISHQILPELIQALRSKGYSFTTV